MAAQRPKSPARRIAAAVSAAPTPDWTVRRCYELRVPNLGEKREEFELQFGERRRDGCRERPAPGGASRDRTGLFRVTAAPVWMQAVVAPVVRACHAAFPEAKLKLRTATWRNGVRLLADGRSDLHCGGLDTGKALPAHLRRERFLGVAAGIVAARGHPLPAAGPEPRDLADRPWIDLDGTDATPGGRSSVPVRPALHYLRQSRGSPSSRSN